MFEPSLSCVLKHDVSKWSNGECHGLQNARILFIYHLAQCTTVHASNEIKVIRINVHKYNPTIS